MSEPDDSNDVTMDSRTVVVPSGATRPVTIQDRYRLKKFHARGGMGEVWVSEDIRMGREVALKKLLPGAQHGKERFIAEARITGLMEHPGVVPVHDLGVDSHGQPFYIMTFLRGRSLKQAIAEYHASKTALDRQVRWVGLLQTFVHLCHVLGYAHSRGIIHRDLKPDNVMLGEFGETIVLDWGLAKVMGQAESPGPGMSAPVSGSISTSNTEMGSILGSPFYMPPEMAEGRTLDTDQRTDVYLLGATLFEILAGRPPREGRSRKEVLEMARTGTPVSPHKIRPEVPKPLAAICLRAMARRPQDRYATAMEIAQEMQRYLAGEPVLAYPEGAAMRLWRWSKRHRTALVRSAAVISIAAAALAAGIGFQQASHYRQREEARQQKSHFTAANDEARFYAANTNPLGEHAPYYDPQKARLSAQAALAIADNWGSSYERFPFTDQIPTLRNDAYELLLLLASDALSRPSYDSQKTDVAADLDKAKTLNPGLSLAYHRLRSDYFRMLQDTPHEEQERTLAESPIVAFTAFDWFFLAEQHRIHSAHTTEPGVTPRPAADTTGDIPAAIEAYRAAIQIDPKHYWSRYQLGRCYLSLGQTSEAAEALGACIALRPDAPWGYSTRGMALGLMKRYEPALADFNRALALDAEFRPARLNRGLVYLLQKNREAALADFSAVLAPPENRRLMEAAYYRAQMYLDSNDAEHALQDLSALLAQQPEFSPAYLLRAQIYLARDAKPLGLEDLSSVLKISGASPETLAQPRGVAQRGHLLRVMGAQSPAGAAKSALEQASSDLEQAIRLGQNTSDAWRDLGAVRESLGQTESAVTAYTESLTLNPADVRTHIDRGWALQKLQRYNAARADFASILRADPAHAEAHTGLGYVAACDQSYDEARQHAAAALIYGAGDYLILHNVACIYAEISRTQTARSAEAQEMAVAALGRAIELWRKSGSGPDELQLIRLEPAFTPALRSREDFRRLLNADPRPAASG